MVPCVKVLFPYAVGLALETPPNVLFLPGNKILFGADRLRGSSETAMKFQLVQLLGGKSKKSSWVLLVLVCYCWHFIVVPLQMIMHLCLMKVHFCYSLCVVNIENKMNHFMLSAWNSPHLLTVRIRIDGFAYWIILSIALPAFPQNLRHSPCGCLSKVQ